MATVPMFAPDGSLGDIPYERMMDARAAGAKMAVSMKAPDGTTGLIPSDRIPDAVKAGGQILPYEQQEAQHPGFWHAMASDLAGMATGAYHAVTDSDPFSDPSVSDAEKEKLLTQSETNAAAKNAARTQQHGAPYSYAANANEMLGVNVPGMEKSAEEGDVGGVAGHATAPIAAAAGAEALQRIVPVAVEKTTALTKSGSSAIANTARRAYGIANPEALTATESATKALKPRNSRVNWSQDVSSALPDVRRAVDNSGIDLNTASLDDIERATLQAKKDVWGEYESNFTGPNKTATVDASPVAKTIRGTVSQRTLEQNPALADRVEAIAQTYDGRQLSIADLEDRVNELNRETRGIEARYPADKAAAKELPENAPTFAERNALKNLLVSKLDEVAGPGAQELRNRYGALNSFQDVLQRRKAVYERANPESLGEQVGRFEGAGQIARGASKVVTGSPLAGAADIAGGIVTRIASKAGRQMNDSQFLLRQALRKTAPRAAMVQRVTPQYIPPTQPTGLPSGATRALPPGVYAQPGGFGTPPTPELSPGIRGFLPRGVYEQPGSSINQPALPPYRGIQLPEATPAPPISRWTRAQSDAAFNSAYPNDQFSSKMSPNLERLWQEGAGFSTAPEEDIGAKVRAKMPSVPRKGRKGAAQ